MLKQISRLREIGLTEGELRVYEALLELGEGTKTPIAERSGVSPSKIYDVLHRLAEKGLVSSIRRGSVQRFRPASPERLRDYLKEKAERLRDEQEVVESVLPSLLMGFREHAEETDAEVFKGWKGVETVYQQIVENLKAGETDLVFGAGRGEDQERTKLFFTRFNRWRHEKGIRLNIIFNEQARGNALGLDPRLDEARYLAHTTPAEINIAGNTVIILVLSAEPLAVRITSGKVADSFRQYFMVMWGIAGP